MSEDQTTPEPQQHIIEEIIYEDDDSSSGCRGCLYGVFGAIGCFVILIVLLVGAIAVARPAVEDAFNGIANIISGERQTRNITLPVVERIQNLRELKTVQYNFSNIVESAVEMPPLLASLYGENVIMIAVGHIEAGIDLTSVTQDDVILDGDTVILELPAPQIFNCFLDEQQSEVVERNRGVLAPANVELDNATRRFALRQFLELALEDGILQDASTEAENTIRQLVTFIIGDDNTLDLVITFVEPVPPASLPTTCPT